MMTNNTYRLILGLREAITSAQIEYERTLLEIEMVAGSIDKLALTEKIDSAADVLSRYVGHMPNSVIRKNVAAQVKAWIRHGHTISAIGGMLEAYVDGVKAALDTPRWPN